MSRFRFFKEKSSRRGCYQAGCGRRFTLLARAGRGWGFVHSHTATRGRAGRVLAHTPHSGALGSGRGPLGAPQDAATGGEAVPWEVKPTDPTFTFSRDSRHHVLCPPYGGPALPLCPSHRAPHCPFPSLASEAVSPGAIDFQIPPPGSSEGGQGRGWPRWVGKCCRNAPAPPRAAV